MYSYTVVVTNNHDKAITNGVISVATQFQNSIFLTKDANTVFSPQSIKAPIQPGASEELEVFIKMFSLEERIINVSFQYSVQEAQDLDMAASFRENLLVLSPFFTSFTFFDENLLQLPNGASLQSCRPFFMCASLQPSTPYPLEIVRSEVEFTEGERCFKALNTSAEFTLPEAVDKPVDVSINSRYQLWFKLQPTEECPLNMNVFVGTLHVTYTRCPKNDTDEPSLLNFEANIQPVKLETPAFIVERCKKKMDAHINLFISFLFVLCFILWFILLFVVIFRLYAFVCPWKGHLR